MAAQLNFGFEPELPSGFRLVLDFVGSEEEMSLLRLLRETPLRSFAMRGVTAKRRIAQYGWHYSFDSNRLTPAPPLPPELEDLRVRAGQVAQVPAQSFTEALVTEYQPGAGIGWHRDAPPFGVIAGISLGGSCRMRLRPRDRTGKSLAVLVPPRSIYVIEGIARSDWEHMIPPVKEGRYSITFRTLRDP